MVHNERPARNLRRVAIGEPSAVPGVSTGSTSPTTVTNNPDLFQKLLVSPGKPNLLVRKMNF